MNFRKVLLLAVSLGVVVMAIPYGPVHTAGANTSKSVELDLALDDQTKTATLTFRITATNNGTVSVPSNPSSGDANVDFEFSSWRSTTAGGGGSSSSWSVRNGEEYEIEYDVSVSSGANNGFDGTVSTLISISGPASPFSETLSVNIDYLTPSFGTTSDQSENIKFLDGSDSTESASLAFDISNTGDGIMVFDSLSFSGVPSGMTVESDSLPNEIDPNSEESASIDISVDSSLAEGTYYFTVTAIDNLGGSEAFTVTVDVIAPPAVGVNGNINVGDVLVGTEKAFSLTINEEHGYTGLSGLTADTSSPAGGSISFSGLSFLSTSPGGSESITYTLTVPDTANQHEELTWDVTFSPDRKDGFSDSTTMRARVIYPPYFGTVSFPSTTLVFDQPRDRTESFSKTIDVKIPNGGDLPMDIQSVSAEVANPRIDAEIVDAPDEVSPFDSRNATVRITADSSTAEESWPVTVTINADRAGTKEVESTVSINHEVDLDIRRTSISFGEVVITKPSTISTDIRERLGYKNINNLHIERINGTDRWLEIVEQPTRQITAGESATVVFELRFTPSVNVFESYRWVFQVDGSNINPETITLRATAKPISFEEAKQPLEQFSRDGGWEGDVAAPSLEMLNQLETRLKQNDSVNPDDLPTAIAAVRSTTLFIRSTAEAKQRISNHGHENATTAVVRSAAAFKLIRVYNSRLSPELRARSNVTVSAAQNQLDNVLADHRQYYQTRLDRPNVTAAERAAYARLLSRLAFLRGNLERSQRLRSVSEEAFNQYLSLVREGHRQRFQGETIRAETTDSMLVVIFDQPLLLNPANLDRFNRNADQSIDHYNASITAFEEAGASQQAEKSTELRQAAVSDFRTARNSLYIVSVVYLISFLAAMGHVGRETHAYLVDSKAAVSGDFLV